MTEVTGRAILAILDAIANGGTLSRQLAHHDFNGKDKQHDSRTIKGLTDRGAFQVTKQNHNFYPLQVKIILDHELITNISLIGNYINYEYKGHLVQRQKVIGFAYKKDVLHFKVDLGSNYYYPISFIKERFVK